MAVRHAGESCRSAVAALEEPQRFCHGIEIPSLLVAACVILLIVRLLPARHVNWWSMAAALLCLMLRRHWAITPSRSTEAERMGLGSLANWRCSQTAQAGPLQVRKPEVRSGVITEGISAQPRRCQADDAVPLQHSGCRTPGPVAGH